MATIKEINEIEWKKWVDSRPSIIQDLCKRFPPTKLYRLNNSGHRVTLYSYSEDGTMTVSVTGEYNAIAFDRRVFGIEPDNLEECDLPEEGELFGTVFTAEEDINAVIEQLRNSTPPNTASTRQGRA